MARARALVHLRAADRAMARVMDQLSRARFELGGRHGELVRQEIEGLNDPSGRIMQYANDEFHDAKGSSDEDG